MNQFNLKKMNYEEILEVLKSKIGSVYDFAFEVYTCEELGLGEIEEVEQYGGEGEGDTWYSIKHFKDHDVYIKILGWYQSYSGTEFYNEWNCCSNVRPVEKVVIVFE